MKVLRLGVNALSPRRRQEFLEDLLLNAGSASEAASVFRWRREISRGAILRCLAHGTPPARDIVCSIVMDRHQEFSDPELADALGSCLTEGIVSGDREMVVDALVTAQALNLVAFVETRAVEIRALLTSDDGTVRALARKCLRMLTNSEEQESN